MCLLKVFLTAFGKFLYFIFIGPGTQFWNCVPGRLIPCTACKSEKCENQFEPFLLNDYEWQSGLLCLVKSNKGQCVFGFLISLQNVNQLNKSFVPALLRPINIVIAPRASHCGWIPVLAQIQRPKYNLNKLTRACKDKLMHKEGRRWIRYNSQRLILGPPILKSGPTPHIVNGYQC